MENDEHKEVSPWLYIITLYVPFGMLSYFMYVPTGFMKLLGYSNSTIGLVSGLFMITALRFLYAPFLDSITTKRRLSVFTLFVSGIVLLLGAGAIRVEPSMEISLIILCSILILVAFCSAAYETASDGYYIRVLSPERQAEFIGIKTAAIRFGSISATMGLIYWAARIAKSYGSVGVDSVDKHGFYVGYSVAYCVAGVLLISFALWNKFMIPVIAQDKAVKHKGFPIWEVLKEYFKQERVVLMILVIVIFRFGQGFLFMRNPFLLDPVSEGGMNSPATAMPLYSMLTDVPWMILGGVLGGYVIKWYGIRKTFIPLALFMSLPNFFYAWLAWVRPEHSVALMGESLNTAMLIGSSFESLGYGLSFSALFYYMHITATMAGHNKTSILAVSMCIMNIGFSLPQMLSGILQKHIGYAFTFLISSLVGLLVIFIIPFLHLPDIKHMKNINKEEV